MSYDATPGMRNLTIGALSLCFGLFITAVSGTAVVAYGAILIGAVEIVVGGAQYVAHQREQAAQRRVVRQSGKSIPKSLENPTLTWTCPRCSGSNPNTTYACGKCRYSLV